MGDMKHSSIIFILLAVLSSLWGQEGIMNGKDDVAFAKALARWGYYDLAEVMSEKIVLKSSNEQQRLDGQLLRCSFFQIRGEQEPDFEKKSELYRQSVDCYKKLIPLTEGMSRLQLKNELGDILINQARGLVTRVEDEPDAARQEVYRKTLPFLEEAQELFKEVKSTTDTAGSDFEPRDEGEEEKGRVEKAFLRYHAWYGYCRALYFKGICGEKGAFDLCLRELEAYIWDYEGKEGAYYAILLRGMVLHEKQRYEEAVDCYDGVTKALQDTYLFRVEPEKQKGLSIGVGQISSSLREVFEEKTTISSEATVKSLEKDRKWLVNDPENNRKYILSKDQENLNVYQIITYSSVHALRLQGCYYKIKSLIQWGRFGRAIESVNEFQIYLKEIHNSELEDELLGQAIILEMGKAHVGEGEYAKAIEVARKIAEKKTYWGIVAKRLLQKWGQLDPNALANAQNAYLVAGGLWEKDQYKEAILSFMKVVQYSQGQKEIELYTLDSLEKIAQSFWILTLYKESALCYKMLATQYNKYKKIVKVGDKEDKVEIGAKSAYWAYRAYLESYKVTKDDQDKRNSDEMRNYLVTNWENSSYALNKAFDEAIERERQIDENAADAVNQFRNLSKAYQSVKREADQYETALVYIAKCFYKAAEIGLKKGGLDKQKPGTFEYPKEILSDLKRAEGYFKRYQQYASRSKVPEIDTQRVARRRESMAQSIFYLGRVYWLWGNYKNAIENFEKLYKEYPEQAEMAAGAIFFLVRLNMETGKLAEAESLIQEMEKSQSSKGATANTKRYQSFSYYLLGKEYEKKAQELQEELEKIKDEEKRKEKEERYILYSEKAADGLLKWLVRKDDATPKYYDWVGSKLALLGKLFLDKEQESRAADYYRKAYPLFSQCLDGFEDEQKRVEIRIKLTECAIKVKNWERAVYVFYPVYRQDKQKRAEQREKEMGTTIPRKKPTTQRVDPVYLDYISQILAGISEQSAYDNAKKLYFFLIPYIHRDLMDDLQEFAELNGSEQSMYEKYKFLKESIAMINGDKLSDEEKKEMDERFKTERNDLVQRQKNPMDLIDVYKPYCQDLIKQHFPLEPAKDKALQNISEAEAGKRVRRVCIYLGYELTSKLVDDLPRYKNTQIRFGFYDNPLWWDAKYRQIYLIYLKGDRGQAKNLIETLRIQQKKLGGPTYSEKFTELLNKCK